MTAESIWGVVRTILASLSGIIATKGWMDEGTYSMILGAAGTIFVAAWSIIQKRGQAQEVKTAAVTGVVPK